MKLISVEIAPKLDYSRPWKELVNEPWENTKAARITIAATESTASPGEVVEQVEITRTAGMPANEFRAAVQKEANLLQRIHAGSA